MLYDDRLSAVRGAEVVELLPLSVFLSPSTVVTVAGQGTVYTKGRKLVVCYTINLQSGGDYTLFSCPPVALTTTK